MENTNWTTHQHWSVAAINSAHASPTFLVPKADQHDLPCWVNDYQVLNANTILDAFPLPQVDDILADCAQTTIWLKMDMTNSFFQTLMKPDNIWNTAVTTPFGLYEWIVMPMGLWNSPLIHQYHVTAALWHLIGKICHVYIDDIIIWSKTVQDHTQDVQLVLQTLHDASLYLQHFSIICRIVLFCVHTLASITWPRGYTTGISAVNVNYI